MVNGGQIKTSFFFNFSNLKPFYSSTSIPVTILPTFGMTSP